MGGLSIAAPASSRAVDERRISDTRLRLEAPLAFGLSIALVWLAQFHRLRDFGLYEDDYWFISEAMGKGPAYLLTRLQTAVTTLPQGRPLGFFLPDALAFVGDRLGGLAAIYILGWLVVSLNTFLCFRLLRTRLPLGAAIVGAAVFCLFPADTTKILLTHDFQLQPSLTFALLAALAYASSRAETTNLRQARKLWPGRLVPRVAPYLLSAGALLAYESGFLALFALPLLVDRWDRRLPRRLALHAAGLVAVLVIVVALRFATGEGRATSSAGSVATILPPLLGSLVLGPLRSLAGMVYGPFKAIPTWDAETAVAAVVALAAFGALLGAAARHVRAAQSETRPERIGSPERAPASAMVAESARVMAAGGAMLVLGYALAFTHFPPNALVGRGTSVHLGATLGMAVLAAGAFWLSQSLRPRLALPMAGMTALYLAIAVGYYVTIERDFARAWQQQRAFWQQVAACCADLADGTVLLYELKPTEEPTFIFANSWADPLVLSETFEFPGGWSTPPRLFSLTQWTDRVQQEGDHLRWWVPGASWDEHWEVLPRANVILLRRGPDGTLVRITGPVDTPAGPLELKAVADSPGAWPPAQLYPYLLK